MTAAIAFVLFTLAQQADTAPKLAGKPCAGPELVGTWQLAEMSGQPAPSESTFYKHVTPTHFVVLSIEPTGKLDYAHGGRYKVSAGTYTESVTHGFGQPFQAVGGQTIEFHCRIDGDRWHTVSSASEGGSFDEVWRRVTAGSKY